MTEEESANQGEKKIAHTISKLPHLEDGYMRVVHITTPHNAEKIKGSGLDYGKYGMAMSMAVAWGKEEEVVFGSDDPRFNYPGLKVVVMDMPAEEWKLHNDITKCPGKIPESYIVGIVGIVRK